MRIRIAQKLIQDGLAAQTLEEGKDGVGLQIPWIEVDGKRVDRLSNVVVKMGNFGTEVVVTFLAAPEIVFVDVNGVELT